MRLSVRTVVRAVAGSLVILPKCNASSIWKDGAGIVMSSGEVTPMSSSGRQLAAEQPLEGTVVAGVPWGDDPWYWYRRTLTSVEEAEEEEPQNSLHVNATGLTANCEGCSVALTLIQTSLCVTTDAHDSALQVPLEDSLTYIADENGSTGGWKTQHFRELQDSNKTLPLSLVDVLNPDLATPADYKIAVYLYDMEENPIACATLELASEEEAKMYADMFDFDGGDDGPDAETVNSLGDDTSAGSLKLVCTIVTGLSLFASAMLIFV